MFIPKEMRLNDFEEVIIPTPREMCQGSLYNMPVPVMSDGVTEEDALPPNLSKTELLMLGHRNHRERPQMDIFGMGRAD